MLHVVKFFIVSKETGEDDVVTVTAIDHIVAVQSKHDVIGTATVEDVGARLSD